MAVFELENNRDDDRVAYSLWKVLSVRAPLRVVFAYRADWESGRALVHGLGEAETFPHGFFKIWRLDAGVGAFRKVP